MTLRIGVVVEDKPDFTTGTTLADRMLCEKVNWLESELLEHVRVYRGLSNETSYVQWTDDRLKTGAFGKNHFGPQAGHFQSRSGVREPAADDALATRRVLIQMKLAGVEVVLLFRDEDRCKDRGKGLHQARDEEERRHQPLTVVIGLARTKRECWVLAGFEPRGDDEMERLQNERTQLGFDPRMHAERLTAKHDAANDKLSAKRVLSALTQDDHVREAACWEATGLSILRSRGGETGLADFLAEVEQRLVPFVTPSRPT